MSSLISIIIPAFNSVQYLNATLESVISQDYKMWECIIIDDGSTDKTEIICKNIAANDNRIKFLKRPDDVPKGANSCRNIGIDNSQGDFLMFLDADDLIAENCLTDRLKYLVDDDNPYDLVVADTGQLINDVIKQKSINKDPDINSWHHYLMMFISYDLPWTIMSVLWKRSTIENIRFDPGLHRFQDVDFHINCLKSEPKIKRLNQIDNYYRLESDKASNPNHIVSVIENLKPFLQKHMGVKSDKSKTNDQLRMFTSKILWGYVFPNYNAFKNQANQLLNFLLSSHLFSMKQKLLIRIKRLFIELRVDTVKNIGMHKFSTFIRKELEK